MAFGALRPGRLDRLPAGVIAVAALLACVRPADLARAQVPATAQEPAQVPAQERAPSAPSAASASSAPSAPNEPSPELAGAPRFALPLDCTPGDDCFVQNHFDRDPGPGTRDYACGALTYDGHTGTDLRLLDLPQMERGVEVVAAAPGRVVAVHDGDPDVSMHARPREALARNPSGNAVRIAHADGWETQYSHLRRGSVRVRVGQPVVTGQPLGQVGLSGRTEFPHLDFTVRHHGRALDPFAPQTDTGCAPATFTLWSDDVANALRYRASGVLFAGFASGPLERERAERGQARGELAPRPDALVFYVEVFGVLPGDVERIDVIGPDGEPVAVHETTVRETAAVRYGYVGRRVSKGAMPEGRYSGRYQLVRDGRLVLATTRETQVR